ncbi:MAG: endonuclease MutS2 [Defluviitaleaceae bacterium]|nr:endonuclease MutS2 [Defluviitaleaceae bacterium]
MDSKALKILEFNKIIDRLAEKAISPMGKELAADTLPLDNLEKIQKSQRETSEAVSVILKKGSLPLGGLRDVRAAVKRADVGGMLGIVELFEVGEFLYVCRKVSNYAKAQNNNVLNDNLFSLEEYFNAVKTIDSLEKEINRCLPNENEIADGASSELLSIRKAIKTSNSKIMEHLNSIIHSGTYKTMLQDAVITMRGGRYCVPIKAEYKTTFNGMIHDQSSTGATVFMEPLSVVQLNNKLKELAAEEKDEIDKILRQLSGLVSENSFEILQNNEMLTYLDVVFAKGELSLSMNGIEPVFNEKGYINIKKGRHPLIDPKVVVPIDIYLGDSFNTLLVTGPNTGGKTVSLKTIGLFTLMGQAGLHIAASDGSELAIFDNVFADIGDEQSIEQSLSTFSSHMTNIVRILDKVTCDSLVLLDELGAGTDPTEGAALAISILEYLHGLKVRTAITTHYSELKIYALQTECFENACCEFDVATLRPTYKLLIGIPGKSNAFAISEKLGLPMHIISAAKDILSSEEVRFEDVITDLEISRKALESEQAKAEALRRESERLHSTLEQQKEKLQAQRDKIVAEAKLEARLLMQKTKDEANAMIKELKEQIRESSDNKAIEQSRLKIHEKLKEVELSSVSLGTGKGKLISIKDTVKEGELVFVDTFNKNMTVASKPTSSGDVMVVSGNMRVKVKVKNLFMPDKNEIAREKALSRESFKSPKSSTHSVKSSKSKFISQELDIRGQYPSDGVEKVDKYIDDAKLSNLNKVMIIHGKGTGVLRDAIHDHLRTNPLVKEFRLGTFGEGEAGVTVVELR